jgi:hypothetical protein
MKPPACQQFLDHPDGNEGHLLSCRDCQELVRQLERLDEAILSAGPEMAAGPSLATGQLPLAPWEGARHRSWLFLAGGALALASLAAAFFSVAGIDPAAGFRAVLFTAVPPLRDTFEVVRRFATGLRYAPTAFHLVVGVSFVAVNAVLLLLLRRSPRGVDVSSR